MKKEIKKEKKNRETNLLRHAFIFLVVIMILAILFSVLFTKPPEEKEDGFLNSLKGFFQSIFNLFSTKSGDVSDSFLESVDKKVYGKGDSNKAGLNERCGDGYGDCKDCLNCETHPPILELLSFWSTSCGPCMVLKNSKQLKNLDNEFSQVSFIEVDVSNPANEFIKKLYKIEAIPALVLRDKSWTEKTTFTDGAVHRRYKQVGKWVGFQQMGFDPGRSYSDNFGPIKGTITSYWNAYRALKICKRDVSQDGDRCSPAGGGYGECKNGMCIKCNPPPIPPVVNYEFKLIIYCKEGTDDCEGIQNTIKQYLLAQLRWEESELNQVLAFEETNDPNDISDIITGSAIANLLDANEEMHSPALLLVDKDDEPFGASTSADNIKGLVKDVLEQANNCWNLFTD